MSSRKPSFWERYVVPPMINCACGNRVIQRQREKVVPGASGRVLELGMGSGLNLAFYDRTKVTSLEAVEPSEGLRKRGEAAGAAADIPTHIVDGRGEELPFEAGSFDCVVCTFTLCSVCAPDAALAEARRVLKPGGRLLYCEHGLSPDPKLARWQRRWEPLWTRLTGGCHLARPVTSAIVAAGFRAEWTDSMALPGAPPIAAWNEWGAAVPA